MRIDSKATMAGLPILRVRDALKRIAWREWTADWLQELLAAEDAEIDQLMALLLEEGLIEPDRNASYWRTTTKGNAFTLATARPVSRATAQRHLDAFLKRVSDVRESEEWLYKVREVRLFGSFLDPEALIVGDVDLAIDLVPKHSNKTRQHRLEQEYIRRQCQSGRTFKNFLHQLVCPSDDVMKHLKARSPILSLHPMTDLQGMPSAAFKQIYEDASH